jgi:hypothetical protein
MSATEVIELIKKLPPDEQAEVEAFLRNGDGKAKEIKFASDEDFDRAAKNPRGQP